METKYNIITATIWMQLVRVSMLRNFTEDITSLTMERKGQEACVHCE